MPLAGDGHARSKLNVLRTSCGPRSTVASAGGRSQTASREGTACRMDTTFCTPPTAGRARAEFSKRDPLTATRSLGGPSPRLSEVGYSPPGLVPGQEHAVGKRPGLHQVQVHPAVVQGREE